MDLFRTKYITLLLSFILITGALVYGLLTHLFPQFYPQWYMQILIFFFCVEMALIYVIDIGSKKLEQKKLVNLYMSTRVAKILFALVFIGAYSLMIKSGIKNFVLIFMVFYFLSIPFETYYFMNIEKRIKERKDKNNNA